MKVRASHVCLGLARRNPAHILKPKRSTTIPRASQGRRGSETRRQVVTNKSSHLSCVQILTSEPNKRKRESNTGGKPHAGNLVVLIATLLRPGSLTAIARRPNARAVNTDRGAKHRPYNRKVSEKVQNKLRERVMQITGHPRRPVWPSPC